MKKWIVFVCVVLLVAPCFTNIDVNTQAGEELVREIKTFTIFDIPNGKDYLFVLDGIFNDISIVDEEKHIPIKIKLATHQKTKWFKPGDIVESICFREKNPEDEVIYKYINCDFAIVGEKEIDSEITGIVYAINREKGLFVIESNLSFYRIVFDENIDTTEFSIGDNLRVTGKSVINRPFLITSANYKIVEDEENKRLLKSCIISSGGWHDGLFRIRTNNEYWQVNFLDEQPNEHLKSYMEFAVKGVKDFTLEQTLHECVLLDILSKRNIAGKVIEVLPSHSIVSIVDTQNTVHKAFLEAPESELKNIEVDQSVRITGYQIETIPDLPLQFCEIFPIDEDIIQPVSFSGEIYECESCEKDKIITVSTGKRRWNILTPDDFNCKAFEMGDWVRVDGSIQSYNSKIIKAETLEKSKVKILAKIASNSKKGSDTMVSDLFTKTVWLVEPTKGGKSFFRRGDIYQITGDLSEDEYLKIENATFKQLNQTKGEIISIDSYNQQMTIKNIVNIEMIIKVNPEWYNIDNYSVGEWVEATGTKSKHGLEDVIIDIIEKKKDY